MNFVYFLLIIFASFTAIKCAKLPNYYKKCKKNDQNFQKCVLESAIKGWPEVTKGDSSIHIMPLNPLHVPQFFINIQDSLKINLTNLIVFGLDDIKFLDMNLDMEKKYFETNFTIPVVSLIGNFDVEGKVLILTLKGQGINNITFENGKYRYGFSFDIVQKKNKEYIKLVKNTWSHELGRVYIDAAKLFGNDTIIGTELGKFFDENWREVADEIGPDIGKGLSEVISQIIGEFFAVVPVSELFE